MTLIEEARQSIEAGQTPERQQVQALLEAYDELLEEVERLRTRLGDLEFHYEVFEHLMTDRKQMIEKLADLGLEIYSLPNPDKGSWGWAWRWRNEEPHTGYERSINALLAALESLLKK